MKDLDKVYKQLKKISEISDTAELPELLQQIRQMRLKQSQHVRNLYAHGAEETETIKKLANSINKLKLQELQILHLTKLATNRESSDSAPKIIKPPGSLALRVTAVVFSKERHQQVFESLIADWQEEYFEALSQGEGRMKLFFIRVRYSWALVQSTFLDSILRILKSIFVFVGGS